MNSVPGYLVVPFLGLLLFTFPGILFLRLFNGFNALAKITAAIFLSIGSWICLSWFISWFGLPLNCSVFALLLAFVIWFLAKSPKSKVIFPAFRPRRWPLDYVLLVVILLVLIMPLFFITIPPGCDTSMHGYITRLIINNNGLPHSYRPILPVDYFGSYSAGYHVFTALISGLSVRYLKDAINFVSIITYPLALLGLIFALRNFFAEKTAIYTSIIFFCINRTYIGTIWWGGNPSIMAFAFCLFSFGLFMYGVQNKRSAALYVCAISVAAIPLCHAIPAITFVYVSFVGYVLVLFYYRHQLKWLITNTLLLVVGVVVLLLPFLIHFKNDNSPELVLMIKNWQHDMMNGRLTGKHVQDMFVTADRIKYRIGDVLTILSGISLATLLYYRKFKPLIFIGILILFIFVLVFNSGYWFLPLSELLYPERVICFMVVCWSFIFGYFLTVIESKGRVWRFLKMDVTVYSMVVLVMAVIALKSVIDEETGLCKTDQINCNKQTMAAFDWINSNTERDALFVASYADAGMWIPTFTNRPTLGSHMHFIHIVQHISDSLNASKSPRYYFVTKRDINTKSDLMGAVRDRTKLFSNREVEIYR